MGLRDLTVSNVISGFCATIPFRGCVPIWWPEEGGTRTGARQGLVHPQEGMMHVSVIIYSLVPIRRKSYLVAWGTRAEWLWTSWLLYPHNHNFQWTALKCKTLGAMVVHTVHKGCSSDIRSTRHTWRTSTDNWWVGSLTAAPPCGQAYLIPCQVSP